MNFLFLFRNHKVRRAAYPLSHAQVVTATACQGSTMKAGVVIDCDRHAIGEAKQDDGDWCLDVCVMLSRATVICYSFERRAWNSYSKGHRRTSAGA